MFSVQQVLAADQRLWHIVSQESRGNLTIGAGLPAPLDAYIAAASKNPLVIACITPLPKPADVVPHTPGLPKGLKGKGHQGKGGKDQKGKGKGRNNAPQGSDAAPNKTSLKELLDNLPNNCVRATDEGPLPLLQPGHLPFPEEEVLPIRAPHVLLQGLPR